MSYTLDLIIETLPVDDALAWQRIEMIRKSYYDDERSAHDRLIQLHQILTNTYPCLCSYADNDPAMDDSPWTDGPLINNFKNEMGMVAITFSRAQELSEFVISASHRLGITVADGQTGAIYRPSLGSIRGKPWWKIW